MTSAAPEPNPLFDLGDADTATLYRLVDRLRSWRQDSGAMKTSHHIVAAVNNLIDQYPGEGLLTMVGPYSAQMRAIASLKERANVRLWSVEGTQISVQNCELAFIAREMENAVGAAKAIGRVSFPNEKCTMERLGALINSSAQIRTRPTLTVVSSNGYESHEQTVLLADHFRAVHSSVYARLADEIRQGKRTKPAFAFYWNQHIGNVHALTTIQSLARNPASRFAFNLQENGVPTSLMDNSGALHPLAGDKKMGPPNPALLDVSWMRTVRWRWSPAPCSHREIAYCTEPFGKTAA